MQDEMTGSLYTQFGLPRLAGGEFQPGESTPDGGEDQGVDDGQQGFVADYLQNVPEDYREHVEPYLQQVERNTNQKFQEHADYRKQWEPYEQLGINEVDPEALEALLTLSETFENEDSAKEWVYNAAEKLGLLEDRSDDEPNDWDETNPEEIIDKSAMQQAVAEQLDEKLQPVLEYIRGDQQQRQVNEADERIDQSLKALREEHGEFDEDAVLRFALAYDSEDAIERGHADYMAQVAQIEQNLLETNGGQPRPPEGGGKPNTNAEPITEFKDAGQHAKERLAVLNSQ